MSPILVKALKTINPLHHWANVNLPKWIRIVGLLAIGVAYTIWPVDIFPDIFFPVGYSEDLGLNAFLAYYIYKIAAGDTQSPRDAKALPEAPPQTQGPQT